MEYKGHNILMQEDNITITDSFLIKRADFESFIQALRDSAPENPVLRNRTDKDLKAEIAVHTLFYNLGILRSRTKSVDLNFPLRKVEKICYSMFGKLCMRLIK